MPKGAALFFCRSKKSPQPMLSAAGNCMAGEENTHRNIFYNHSIVKLFFLFTFISGRQLARWFFKSDRPMFFQESAAKANINLRAVPLDAKRHLVFMMDLLEKLSKKDDQSTAYDRKFPPTGRWRLCRLMRGTWKGLMRLLLSILCLFPLVALADYPDPRRKQGPIDIFANTMTHPQGMVVVTGSSSILRWRSIYKDLAPTHIIATSIAETNMNDLDYYLEEMVLRYRPRAVVIYQGENDLTIDCVSVGQVVRTFSRIVTRINASYPDISMYFVSIKPTIARWHKWPEAARINERIAAMASETDFLEYVDVAGSMLDREGLPRAELFVEDGVHLNEEGYRIWTSILQPILANLP